MFDLSIGKLLVIGLVALFFISPDRLPVYAAQLGNWVRVARTMATEAKQRVAVEMGPEFEDVDWASLDPRRYHPRRLLMDAWNAEPGEGGGARTGSEDDVPSDGADEPDLLELADARAAASQPPAPATSHHELGS